MINTPEGFDARTFCFHVALFNWNPQKTSFKIKLDQ